MSLFSYFYMGLRSLNAAQMGLQMTGDNISNVSTPGYARRRLELGPSYPTRVPGGLLDQGVDVVGFRRMEDRFLEAGLLREQGRQSGSQELLRGLRQVEQIHGSLENEGGIAAGLSGFSAAFDVLAADPENLAVRGSAVAAADNLARALNDAYGRLEEQRALEDRAVGGQVQRINKLSEELAELNRQIATEESSGAVAAPLRDQRSLIVEELAALTGGTGIQGSGGRVGFALPGGPTLVAGDTALPLTTSQGVDGTLRIHSGGDGTDVTDRIRQGSLGSLLYLRDETIAGQLAELDTLAADLTTRVNALTTSASDLQGAAGVALLVPDPPVLQGAARRLAVNSAIVNDPGLLAVSADGSPGNSDVASQLAALPADASAALGGRSANDFYAGMLSSLGNEIVQTDVTNEVSAALVDGLLAQRDAVSGVSLDEEAVELIRHQRSYEAAARFMQVINDVTQVAVSLVD